MTDLVSKIIDVDDRLERLETGDYPSLGDPVYSRLAGDSFLQGRNLLRWQNWGSDHRNWCAASEDMPWASTTGFANGNYKTTSLYQPQMRFDRTAGDHFWSTTANFWSPGSGVLNSAERPGITVGSWVKIGTPVTACGFLSNWNLATGAASWRLSTHSTYSWGATWSITNTGTTLASHVITTSSAIPTGEWVFVIGTWYAGSYTRVWWFSKTASDMAEKTSGVISTITTTASFFAGNFRAAGPVDYFFDGHMGLNFYACSAIDTTEAEMLFHYSRGIYGV